MERGLLLFTVLRRREVCCSSWCYDGERSVVVRMGRGLLLFRLSGWGEMCYCSGV